jgi:nucleotide-binding universal stress UspA family protein
VRYLVGYVADGPGRSALALARMLASVDERVEIVLCHVLPETTDLPARGAPATGYDQILHKQAEQWLAEGREQLPDIDVQTLVRTAPSPAAGLAGTVDEVGAQMLVVGSARHGLIRRLTVGSVAVQLLRSSPVPVAVAPLGFDLPEGTSLQRVSCGFLDRPGDTATVLAARQLARRNALPIRLVTVVVAEGHGLSPFGHTGEAQAPEEHRAQTVWAADRAAGGLPDDMTVERVVASGADLESALAGIDWLEGEVLFLGSSRLGEPARVLLSPTATAILRSAPVAVVAIPRGADVSLETTTEMPVLAGGDRNRSDPGRPTGEHR